MGGARGRAGIGWPAARVGGDYQGARWRGAGAGPDGGMSPDVLSFWLAGIFLLSLSGPFVMGERLGGHLT